VVILLNFFWTAVAADWLDEELSQFPLFIVMAAGARSFKRSCDNKEGHLVPSTYNGINQTVQVFVRGAGRMDVRPQHLLPKHPHKSPGPNSVCLVTPLKGARKGQVTRLVKVEGEMAWIYHWDDDGEGVLEHQRIELALTKAPLLKKA
jgi:hypothetical protein